MSKLPAKLNTIESFAKSTTDLSGQISPTNVRKLFELESEIRKFRLEVTEDGELGGLIIIGIQIALFIISIGVFTLFFMINRKFNKHPITG
jgi:hypothetical protein